MIDTKKSSSRLSRADKMRLAQEQNAREYASQAPVLKDEVLDGELITKLDCRLIDKNPFQNRTRFDVAGIEELAEQIRLNGQTQPIGVRKAGNRYQIIFGERRWRACLLLDSKLIDVVVREVSDVDMAYQCYSENSGRERIHDYEKALSIKNLNDLGRPKEEIMERLGMKKQDYYKTLKFLSLPSDITSFLDHHPHALGRNEASDLDRIYADFGSDVPENFVEETIRVLGLYVSGEISSRSQIIKDLRAMFTVPKKRNREKVNQESALFYSESRVGVMVDTPKELRMTISKSELAKDLVDELKVVIEEFLTAAEKESKEQEG